MLNVSVEMSTRPMGRIAKGDEWTFEGSFWLLVIGTPTDLSERRLPGAPSARTSIVRWRQVLHRTALPWHRSQVRHPAGRCFFFADTDFFSICATVLCKRTLNGYQRTQWLRCTKLAIFRQLELIFSSFFFILKPVGAKRKALDKVCPRGSTRSTV